MDLAAIGAMVLGEGHSPATMEIIVPPPGAPRATETPNWPTDVRQTADGAFTNYEAEARSTGELPVAQTLLVLATGIATLQHLVVDGAGTHLNQDEEEDKEEDSDKAKEDEGKQE